MNWLRGTDIKEYCRKIVINEQRSCIFKPAYCYNLSRTVRVGLALKLRFLSNGLAGQSKQYTPHRDLNQYRKCVGVAEVVSSWHYTQDDWIVLVIDWCLKRAWCRQYSPINVSNLLPASICCRRIDRNRSCWTLLTSWVAQAMSAHGQSQPLASSTHKLFGIWEVPLHTFWHVYNCKIV